MLILLRISMASSEGCFRAYEGAGLLKPARARVLCEHNRQIWPLQPSSNTRERQTHVVCLAPQHPGKHPLKPCHDQTSQMIHTNHAQIEGQHVLQNANSENQSAMQNPRVQENKKQRKLIHVLIICIYFESPLDMAEVLNLQ